MEELKTTTPPPFQSQKPACVNKGRPVWISYIGNSNEKPEWEHVADCVDALVKSFEAHNIEYRIDNTSESNPYLTDFERKIGWDSYVTVLVFSDRYFHSMHCMYEFVQIKKALKKYPYKHLFCIKSGNFNLADINYILDLEQFWGDKKQDYEEEQMFHSRLLTNIEHEAYKNGFYLDDVRSLYSFFSTINYINTANLNPENFTKEIIKSYTTASKFSKIIQQRIKRRKAAVKYLGCGCLTLVTVSIIGIVIYAIYTLLSSTTIDEPKFSKGLDGLQINQIYEDNDDTHIYFTLKNPYDHDTTVFAAKYFYLVANGKKYPLYKAEDIPLYPNYRVLASQDSMSFSLFFDAIPLETEIIDLEIQPGVGVYGINLKTEE